MDLWGVDGKDAFILEPIVYIFISAQHEVKCLLKAL